MINLALADDRVRQGINAELFVVSEAGQAFVIGHRVGEVLAFMFVAMYSFVLDGPGFAAGFVEGVECGVGQLRRRRIVPAPGPDFLYATNKKWIAEELVVALNRRAKPPSRVVAIQDEFERSRIGR